MRIWRIMVALAALTACATPQAPPAQVRAITFYISSWGATAERWTIDETGAASLEMRGNEVPLQAPLTPQTFAVSAEGFQRVRAALAPAERLFGRDFNCTDGVTDAPYGRVIWTLADGGERSVSWYAGCLRPERERDAFLERTSEADDLFHQLTGTQ